MSLTEYLKNKNQFKTIIVIDSYKEQLTADLAGLLLKPNNQLFEFRKNLVNYQEIYKILSELNYPLIDEFSIALKTGDPKKVTHAHAIFSRWVDLSNVNKYLSNKIETVLFKYESNLYSKEFTPEDIDTIYKSNETETIVFLEKIAKNIDSIVSKMSNWHYPIQLEALPSNSVATEAKVTIGDVFKTSFICFEKLGEIQIKDIQENNLPISVKSNFYDLLAKLQNNRQISKVLTLYINRPLFERKYFELIKRDIALGIEAILPNHLELISETIFEENKDLWKVKIEEKYIKKTPKGYSIVGDEAPIRWIERQI